MSVSISRRCAGNFCAGSFPVSAAFGKNSAVGGGAGCRWRSSANRSATSHGGTFARKSGRGSGFGDVGNLFPFKAPAVCFQFVRLLCVHSVSFRVAVERFCFCRSRYFVCCFFGVAGKCFFRKAFWGVLQALGKSDGDVLSL